MRHKGLVDSTVKLAPRGKMGISRNKYPRGREQWQFAETK